MKKISLLIVGILFIAFSTTSCSKDDDNGGSQNDKIVGKWELTHEGGIVDGQEILFPYDHEAPECGKDHLVFSGNKSGKEVYYYIDFEDDDCEEEDFNFTWAINGNILTITASGEHMSATILELTNTTLKISYVDDFGDEDLSVSVLKRV